MDFCTSRSSPKGASDGCHCLLLHSFQERNRRIFICHFCLFWPLCTLSTQEYHLRAFMSLWRFPPRKHSPFLLWVYIYFALITGYSKCLVICDSHDYSLFRLSKLSIVFTYCCSPGLFPVFHEHSLSIANGVLTWCIGSLYALQCALSGSPDLRIFQAF